MPRATGLTGIVAAIAMKTPAATIRPKTATKAVRRFDMASRPLSINVNSLQFGAAVLLTNDPSVLDMNDSIREWQETRIMRHNQHCVPPLFGDFGKYLHDRPAILAIQCGGWLVRKDDRRISDNGASDRNALLFPATEFARKRLCLMGQTDLGQCLARPGPCRSGGLTAYIQRQPDVVGGGQRRKQMKRLKDKAHMLSPEKSQVLGSGAGG